MTFVHHSLQTATTSQNKVIGRCTGCGWAKVADSKVDIQIAFATHDLDEPETSERSESRTHV